MVHGELAELSARQPVDARVADVEHHHLGAGLRDQGRQARDGRAHAVRLAVPDDRAVGLVERREHRVHRQRAAARIPRQHVDRDRARHLAGFMPAHPVGHREERRQDEITIFVNPTDAAGGGGGAMKEPGHCRSMTEDLNLCATKVRGEWCLAGRRLRTFRIKERRACMPEPGDALQKLGFLTIGVFDGHNPRQGHEVTLDMISLGERLGFDSAWVRHRHLQFGISSPVAVLAAAAQRTSRIELGTAVIPLGWENPLRLAEDLATVDILSGGRLNPGFSVGPPRYWEDVRAALYPDTWENEDFSYERVSRLLRFVAGETAATLPRQEGFEQFSSRVEPHSPGLRSRMWYGGGSLASARWAGENGVNFLTSSVVRAEEADDFASIQQSHIRAFRAAHKAGAAARVSQGLVVIPTDSASAGQRAKYAAYVAARTPRTEAPVGPAS